MAAIVCKGLAKRYGDVEVVRNFNFEVAEHEFVVFLGPSGCGKSTIMRMIAGLEEISDGELLIAGRLVNALPPRDRGIAMVFQNYALYPHMTVRGNIAFGLERLKVPSAEIDRRVDEVAATLSLEPCLHRKPAELSGGQQQRVAIARAMIKTPQVFLFDEPLSNLDAKLRNHMRIEIARLHQALQTTTVYVTHDQHEAMTLADRIVLLRDGRIEQVGTPREIYEKPRTKYVAGFIGTPAMNLIDMEVAENGDHFELWGDAGRVRVRAGRFDLKGRSRVTLGMRPVHLEVAWPSPGANYFAGTVELVEYLGHEAHVSLRAGGMEIGANVPSSRRPQVHEHMSFTVKDEFIHVFDIATGLALAN
jgi:multiple sugar transport system ATP-binding protein